MKINDQRAIQFLGEIRKPLLVLHKAILDHERTLYEKEFGPVTPAAFLQVLINGSGFRWLSPLSAVIANVDEILDDDKATSADRVAAVESVVGLFRRTCRAIYSCPVIGKSCSTTLAFFMRTAALRQY